MGYGQSQLQQQPAQGRCLPLPESKGLLHPQCGSHPPQLLWVAQLDSESTGNPNLPPLFFWAWAISAAPCISGSIRQLSVSCAEGARASLPSGNRRRLRVSGPCFYGLHKVSTSEEQEPTVMDGEGATMERGSLRPQMWWPSYKMSVIREEQSFWKGVTGSEWEDKLVNFPPMQKWGLWEKRWEPRGRDNPRPVYTAAGTQWVTTLAPVTEKEVTERPGSEICPGWHDI